MPDREINIDEVVFEPVKGQEFKYAYVRLTGMVLVNALGEIQLGQRDLVIPREELLPALNVFGDNLDEINQRLDNAQRPRI
jgi:hypothetical protein